MYESFLYFCKFRIIIIMPTVKKPRKISKNQQEDLIFKGELHEIIIQALQEKLASDIVLIDLREKNAVFFDYLVLCTGNAKPHLETLADFAEECVFKSLKQRPNHIEGRENCEWILVDYFNVILHVFNPETRAYYHIEKLWSDAPQQNC